LRQRPPKQGISRRTSWILLTFASIAAWIGLIAVGMQIFKALGLSGS